METRNDMGQTEQEILAQLTQIFQEKWKLHFRILEMHSGLIAMQKQADDLKKLAELKDEYVALKNGE